MTEQPALRPTRLEIASGVAVGVAPATAAHPTRCPQPTPLAALEEAVLPSVRRPPCLVSFSSGMDSALVLAVAARVARREGLPDPTPVTWRFTDAPHAEESAWQDRIIAELGLGTSWQILRADDDLDLIGPVARRFLRRYGLLHPPNLHLHLPIIELAAGGSVLTGIGGDQVLSGWRRPAAPLPVRLWSLARRARARLRRARMPATEPFPWLHPEVAEQVSRALRADQHAEPRTLGPRAAWHARRRDVGLTCSGLAAVGADHGVPVSSPLLADGFLAALAARFGDLRPVPRTTLIAGIAAGELPEVLFAPRRKALFSEVFFRSPTRDFIRAWDGGDVDPDLVDADSLRSVWLDWPPPPCTWALVQDIWLARHRPRPPADQPPLPAPPGEPAEVPI